MVCTIALEKSYRLMYSNIGLNSRETVPLRVFSNKVFFLIWWPRRHSFSLFHISGCPSRGSNSGLPYSSTTRYLWATSPPITIRSHSPGAGFPCLHLSVVGLLSFLCTGTVAEKHVVQHNLSAIVSPLLPLPPLPHFSGRGGKGGSKFL